MHAQDFQEPKEIQFGQNTKQTKKAHTHKCDKIKSCPNSIKYPKPTHDWRYHFEKITNESKIPKDENTIKE